MKKILERNKAMKKLIRLLKAAMSQDMDMV